jgi:transposase
MYRPLPPITEELNRLQEILRHERNAQRKLRLHLLVLLKSGQVSTQSQAATHLAVHRNTISAWLHQYRQGGLAALLTIKQPGARPGQKSLPPAVIAQLRERLASPARFASYVEVQQWLRDEWHLELPYKTVYGIVRYRLKINLKRR